MRRSLLSKLQLSLLALGLVGGGIMACGDDPAPTPPPAGDGDGDGDDEGDGDGDGDDEGDGDGDQVQETECMTVSGSIEGKGCKLSGGGQGYQLCEDGEPTGKCKTIAELISEFSGDGGLLGDASIDLPDAGPAMDCPSSGGFVCATTSAFGMELIPNKTCNINAGLYTAPPADSKCAKTGDPCTTMGLMGACITGIPIIGNVCAQPCN